MLDTGQVGSEGGVEAYRYGDGAVASLSRSKSPPATPLIFGLRVKLLKDDFEPHSLSPTSPDTAEAPAHPVLHSPCTHEARSSRRT